MGLKVSKKARRELLIALQPEYQQASRKRKKELLDSFVDATGYERKYATVLLNKDIPKEPHRRERKRVYGEDIREALLTIWRQAANGICSKRLVPILPVLIEKMEEFGHLELTEEQKTKLCSMSPATVDRLLIPERRKYGRGKSRTKPGFLLKRQIAIRTFTEWNDVKPGFIEADLVAHCGESTRGQYLHTLTMTDIATTWTEPIALLKGGEADVMEALNEAHQFLPFPLLGLDTDNGGEFINYTLFNWCEENGITFTRSRPYKKNDQAHVEEKNGSVVRRLIGYERYEGIGSWELLTTLYRIARLYVNFFQPTMKLLEKSREGAYTYRKYERAATPYARVLRSSSVSEEDKERLRRDYEKLDPVLLLSEIERIQNELWATAVRAGEPQELDIEPSVEVILPEMKTVPKTDKTRPRTRRSVKTGRRRGRPSNLDDVWSEVLEALEQNPTMSSKDTLSFLNGRYPGRFRRSQLRTIASRLRAWHHERSSVPVFEVRKPGRPSSLDSVWPEVIQLLEEKPTTSASEVFSLLDSRYPSRFRKTQLVTIIRRVERWRTDRKTLFERCRASLVGA